MNLIDIKERIVLGQALSPDERNYVLDAINQKAARDARVDVVINPPNYLGRIDAIWAALSIDDGGEGVVAAPIGPGGMTIPLIAADKQRLVSIMPWAKRIATAFGKPVRLAKFTQREDIEVYQP